MKRLAMGLALLLACTGLAQARGIIIPVEKSIPPLAMVHHRVNVNIDDQIAMTSIEQVFRNHTSRPLEATYVFPVPKGAAVREFAMWVNGTRVKGEVVEADKAKQIYNDIVRQSQDPGILEYLGRDLFQAKVFPIPAKGEQKIEISFQSVANKEGELVEYTYPLKTDGKATSTLEEFSFKLNLKSQHPIVNIYSPTHSIGVTRSNDKQATVTFEKQQAILDKDFVVYYTTGGKDLGMTAMMHRANPKEDGYFMLLVSPRFELATGQKVPRDIVFVIDTSGSMHEEDRIGQAKKALKHCLSNVAEGDRFAVINFATTVNRFGQGLTAMSKEHIDEAKKWVDRLDATGGTAIDEALQTALGMRTDDASRTFTIVFFTDGKPTIGETNGETILKNVTKKNTQQTRIFTFGIGNDLNASLLDQIADQSRGASVFMRPGEDIEAKVAAFYDKISKPVMANLKLTPGPGIHLSEMYPTQLPDLFHGGQLIITGRYHGATHAAVKLTGTVGKETHEFVYELSFKDKVEGKEFVEEIWARRKVGYLLEQIRLNGQQKELVNEVTLLAKKYGIATPYTSYLIMPDAPVPIAGPRPKPVPVNPAFDAPLILRGNADGDKKKLEEVARELQKRPGELTTSRDRLEAERLDDLSKNGKGEEKGAAADARAKQDAFQQAQKSLEGRRHTDLQQNKLGVDFSVQMNLMKNQTQLAPTANRYAYGRNCLELGGVWIDEGFDAKMKTVTVKAQSNAYFKLLDKHPQLREVFKLGNHIVWVTPTGMALVIDTKNGAEELADAEIAALFAK
jgi:Ca-activated chloride channel family protein